MRIELDPLRHVYRLDGNIVPNVTRVLLDLYDWGPVIPEVLEHKRQIGIAVHRAIELDLADDLDRESLDLAIEGYFDAWVKFRRETRFQCHLSECWVASRKFGYAGTLDLAGVFNGVQALIDIKCTHEVHPAAALQTAAYLRAATEMGFIRQARRFALYLRSKGNYRLEPHIDQNDYPVFLACLSRYNWRVANGLAKESA